MNIQTLLNKPKVESNLTPKITKISSLVESSNEIRKSSNKLRKTFEKGTYQKKTQLTVLNRYKKRLDSIQKQNDKRFAQKKKVQIKPPDIKKYTGNLFTAGSASDPLKSLAALSAFNAASKLKDGKWVDAIGPGLVAAGLMFGPGLLKGGISRMGGPGKPSGQPATSSGMVSSKSSYAGTKAGQAYAGMQAQRNLPKWAQKAAGGSASRFAASNERMFQGTANIGDRARLASRKFGFSGAGGIAERLSAKSGGTVAAKAAGVGGRAIPLLGAALNIGLSAYRFSEGDVVGGILSAVSAIPVIGWAALGVDLAREFGAFDGTFLGRKDKLKEQTQKQKELVKGQQDRGGGLTFGKTLNSYERVVNKFEQFCKSFKTVQEINDMTEGGSSNPPAISTDPYTGPIDGNSFNPLPGGTLSNRSVGFPGGEYGADRNYGGHSGQDIGGLPPGSPVVAWKTGKVSYSGSVESGDTIVTIDHGGGVQSVYKHVVPTIPEGSTVYGGQQIATLFNARKYAPHLHFEVWRNGRHVNPNQDISSSQRISSPLTAERAKQNYESSSQNMRIPTPPPQQNPLGLSIGAGGFNINGRPIQQTQRQTPQIASPPVMQRPTLATYLSYDSRSQAGQVIPFPITIPQQQPQMMQQESSAPMMMGPSEEQLLNSFYKRVLLNTLQ
jgi:murein DD-endopeptidase MepM/ murein hydrolase activator NlpD